MSDYPKPSSDDRSIMPWVASFATLLFVLTVAGALPNLKSAFGSALDWVAADKGMGLLAWVTDSATVWISQSFAVPGDSPQLLGHWAGLWAVNITVVVLSLQRLRTRRAAKKSSTPDYSYLARRRGALSPERLTLGEQEDLVAELARLALERVRQHPA